MSPLSLVAYVTLFVLLGIVFLAANLIVGRFLRPSEPSEGKGAIYECGEPPVGESHVRFDLRFYVVALVFLVFEVEVAFFFPWAVVFGTATQMMDPRLERVTVATAGDEIVVSAPPTIESLYRALGAEPPAGARGGYEAAAREAPIREGSLATGRTLAWIALIDMLGFFAIVLVGFAYVWKRGDLEWIRTLGHGARDADATLATVRHDVLPTQALEHEPPRLNIVTANPP
ncbi:MAG TPA: NADH-quinone oxidoreductase subunit A [Pirellulales bacterium]